MISAVTPRLAATILACYPRLDPAKRRITRARYAPALEGMPTIAAEGAFCQMLRTLAAQE
jgi:hypothetical protein